MFRSSFGSVLVCFRGIFESIDWCDPINFPIIWKCIFNTHTQREEKRKREREGPTQWSVRYWMLENELQKKNRTLCCRHYIGIIMAFSLPRSIHVLILDGPKNTNKLSLSLSLSRSSQIFLSIDLQFVNLRLNAMRLLAIVISKWPWNRNLTVAWNFSFMNSEVVAFGVETTDETCLVYFVILMLNWLVCRRWWLVQPQ